MGTNYYLVHNRPSMRAPMHIGKASAGWPFLFHSITFRYDNPFTETTVTSFRQWKELIDKTVASGEAVIMDEYDEIVDTKEFFDLVERKRKDSNPYLHESDDDHDSEGYRFCREYFS